MFFFIFFTRFQCDFLVQRLNSFMYQRKGGTIPPKERQIKNMSVSLLVLCFGFPLPVFLPPNLSDPTLMSYCSARSGSNRSVLLFLNNRVGNDKTSFFLFALFSAIHPSSIHHPIHSYFVMKRSWEMDESRLVCVKREIHIKTWEKKKKIQGKAENVLLVGDCVVP